MMIFNEDNNVMLVDKEEKSKNSGERHTELQRRIKILENLGLIGEGKLAQIIAKDNDANINDIKYNGPQVFEDRKLPLLSEELARIAIISDIGKNYNLKNIILENKYNLGRTKKEKDKRLDIGIKYSNSEDFFAVVEVKTYEEFDYTKDKDIEGQLFNIASIQQSKQTLEIKYLIYCTSKFGEEDNVIAEYVVIDYLKYKNYQDWEKGKKEKTNKIPSNYALDKYVNIKGGDILQAMDEGEINNIKTKINNKLYSGGGVPDNLIFVTVVNVFLSKLYDEETCQNGEDYILQIVPGETNEEFKEKLNNIYRDALINKMNISIKEKDRSSFNITDFSKIKIEQIMFLVELLQKYDLAKTIAITKLDVLGDFFESISRDQFKQTKGQFFTHQKIVDFILDICNIEKLCEKTIKAKNPKLPRIADLSAGSGTFVISAMKKTSKFLEQIKNNANSKILKDLINNEWNPISNPNKWAQQYIYATEKDMDLGTAIKVNMILHGDGQAHIGVGNEQGDGLVDIDKFKDNLGINIDVIKGNEYYSKDSLPYFDLIVSNPPFSVDLDAQTQENINKNFELNGGKNSEIFFLERYYQTLNVKGRAGIIVPESILDGNNNLNVREFLIKYFKIKAVISLPIDTFSPYTTTKTSILLLEKRELPILNFEYLKYSEKELDVLQKDLIEKNISKNISQIKTIENIQKILEIRNEQILYYNIKNISYKRRNNKKELRYEKNDFDVILNMLKNNDIDIWNDCCENENNFIPLSKLFLEKSVRMDFLYNYTFNMEMNSEDEHLLLLSTIINVDNSELIDGKKAKELLLNIEKNPIDYCEINSVDNEGFISSPKNINKDSDNDEIQSLLTKIEKGDIRSVNNIDILVSSVRPYLTKNILIDRNNKKFYFTKAFLPIKIIGNYNKLVVYYFINNSIIKKINAVSRCGKSYPTLKSEDMLNIKLSLEDLNELDRLETNKEKLLEIYNEVVEKGLELKNLKTKFRNFK